MPAKSRPIPAKRRGELPAVGVRPPLEAPFVRTDRLIPADQFTTLLSSIGDALVTVAADGRIAGWSPGAKRLYGYPARDAVKQPFSFLFHPHHRQDAPAACARAASGPPMANHETVHVHRDGSRLDVSLTVCSAPPGAGRPAVFSVIVRNLTELKRRERHQAEEFERLRDSAGRLKALERQLAETRGSARELDELESALTRYRNLFDAAPEAYLVTDTEGVVKEANQLAGSLLGIAPDRLVGLPIAAVVAEPDRRIARGKLSDVRRGQSVERWELRLCPHARPAFTAGISAVLARDPAGGPSTLRWIIRELA